MWWSPWGVTAGCSLAFCPLTVPLKFREIDALDVGKASSVEEFGVAKTGSGQIIVLFAQ